LQPIFHISTETQGDVLLCEFGEEYCCVATLDSGRKKMADLKYYIYDKENSDLFKIVNEVTNTFNKVIFCSALPSSVIIPAKFTGIDDKVFLSAFNNLFYSHVFVDELNTWQMSNIYTIPNNVIHHITKKYPDVLFMHLYTATLNVYNGSVAEVQVCVDFTKTHFRVLVKKDQLLFLAQTFSYSSSFDVIYYLLKICKEFELSKTSCSIILSGFIEANSELFKEIHNYFTNLHFTNAPLFIEKTRYPQHFFTTINNLAACAL
jgi:hypothetical protein